MNLFDKDTHTLVNLSETRVQTDYILLKKGTYTLNFIGADSFYLIIFNENKVKVKETDWIEKNSSFELDNKYYVKIVFRKNNNIALNKDEVVNIKLVDGQGCINVIIDNGLETTDANYKSQIYTIPTQQPFRAIGGTRDTFIKKNNKWYERHYIARKILKGTENWAKSTTYKGSFYSLDLLPTNKDYSDCYSSHFIKANISKSSDIPTNYKQKTFFIESKKGTSNFWYGTENTTVDEFKAWLSAKYNAGTPVYVDYLLETPIDFECTEEQVEQIENKPSTYKDFTYVVSEDETPAYLEVAGIYDLNNLINN